MEGLDLFGFQINFAVNIELNLDWPIAREQLYIFAFGFVKIGRSVRKRIHERELRRRALSSIDTIVFRKFVAERCIRLFVDLQDFK